jgi:flagellar biosynthesis component FlhA
MIDKAKEFFQCMIEKESTKLSYNEDKDYIKQEYDKLLKEIHQHHKILLIKSYLLLKEKYSDKDFKTIWYNVGQILDKSIAEKVINEDYKLYYFVLDPDIPEKLEENTNWTNIRNKAYLTFVEEYKKHRRFYNKKEKDRTIINKEIEAFSFLKNNKMFEVE